MACQTWAFTTTWWKLGVLRQLDGVPVLGAIFAGPPSYLSLFNAVLIVAITVPPFITAISVHVFKTTASGDQGSCLRVGCPTA